MISIAILGATGYGGVELVRLLSRHPGADLVYLSSETYAGQPINAVYPHLGPVSLPLEPLDPQRMLAAEVVFFALPHGKAVEYAPLVREAGHKVVDLGADFRLKDAALYQEWYGFEHTHPELLAKAVYGLPEIYRESLRTAQLVAGPGCYPTSSILPLAPLLRAGLIEPAKVVIDSKSGITGAGRTSLKLEYHFPEADEDVCAYNVVAHRHIPEIEQELTAAAGQSVQVSFTPHLIPMSRGIFTTAYVRGAEGVTTERLLDCLRAAYAREPFVQVLGDDRLPHTKATQGSNQIHLTARFDARSGVVKVFSALDNLGKGMASQAVQAMNIMLGIEERTGIDAASIYP
jgi:N-acetyl-gamma-glutamyl-phosphate reductase